LSGGDAPNLLNRGLNVEASFDYVPAIDQDSTLML
jgi:hypothetical protein